MYPLLIKGQVQREVGWLAGRGIISALMTSLIMRRERGKPRARPKEGARKWRHAATAADAFFPFLKSVS